MLLWCGDCIAEEYLWYTYKPKNKDNDSPPNFPTYDRVRKIAYDGRYLTCSCGFFDRHGIPCAHVYRVTDTVLPTMCHVRWRKVFQYHFGRTQLHPTLVELQKKNFPGVPFRMPSVVEREDFPMLLVGPFGVRTTHLQYERMILILKEERMGNPVVVGQELHGEASIEKADFLDSFHLERSFGSEDEISTRSSVREGGLQETVVFSGNAQVLAACESQPSTSQEFYHEINNSTKTFLNLVITREQEEYVRKMVNEITSRLLKDAAGKMSRSDSCIYISSQPEIETRKLGKRLRTHGYF